MILDVRDVGELMAGCPACPAGARCVGLEVQRESAAGENYGSTFLIVNALFQDAEGVTTKVPAVCKRLPPNEFLRAAFNVNVSHPKEVNFYSLLVPALEALQAELRVPEAERIRCFPRLFGARIGGGKDPEVVDDDAILVLEDLCAVGYRSGDRITGMDLDHCRLALRELAHLHALGIVMRRLRPEVFSGRAFQATCHHFMHDRMDVYKEEMRTLEDTVVKQVLEEVPEVLTLLDENALRKGIGTLSSRDTTHRKEPFYTVVHNDFWVNNMMFAYDDAIGRPERLKMVDFQMTEIGSPVRDLLFFIYSSADSDVLARVDDLVREYHAELERYVRLHGLDGDDLGWTAFQRELEAVAPDAMGQLLLMTSIIRAENKVEKTDNDDGTFARLGVSAPAKTRYLEIVRNFAKKGWVR